MAPPAPPCAFDIRGMAARAHRKAPSTLTSRMARAASVASASIRDTGPVMPELKTRWVRRPSVSIDGREQALDVLFPAHIGLDRHGAAARLLDVRHHGRGAGLVGREIHGDIVAVGGGEPRRRRADAAARAGNENDLVGHACLFPERRRLRAASTLKASTAAAKAIAK